MSMQNLYGNGTVEARVLSAIDFSHAACAKQRASFIRPNLEPGGSAIAVAIIASLAWTSNKWFLSIVFSNDLKERSFPKGSKAFRHG